MVGRLVGGVSVDLDLTFDLGVVTSGYIVD